jgi:hypothetical protein
MLSLGEFEADDPLRAQLPEFLVELFAFGLVRPGVDLAGTVRKPGARRKNN